MSRSYGKVLVRAWADPEWRALDVEAQHLYVLLLSQSTTNLAGVVPLQTRRWAACSAGRTTEDVEGALSRLSDAGFVIVDRDTEEALIRSFVRNDEGYKIPGQREAMLEAAVATQSPVLRRALAVELGRLSVLTGKTAREGMAAIAATVAALTGAPPPPDGGIPEPIQQTILDAIRDTTPDTTPDATRDAIPDGPTDAISDPIPDGPVSVSVSVPRSSHLTTNSLSSTKADEPAPKGRTHSTGDEGFDRFWNAYPRKQGKGDAQKAWRQVTKKTKPSEIMEGLARFQFSADPQYHPLPGSWLRGQRWADQPLNPGARHLVAVTASGDADTALTPRQIEEILGPDYWQPPPPPPDQWDNPRDWNRKQIEAHRAERVRQAIAKLRGGEAKAQ